MTTAASAADIDLSVSSFVVTPTPAPRGASIEFSLGITNNETAIDANGVIHVEVLIPRNVDISSSVLPSGCRVVVASTTLLICSRSGLARTALWRLSFHALGSEVGAYDSTASVSFLDLDNDANPNNNRLVKTVTVTQGADLSVVSSGGTGLTGCPAACTAAAGAAITYQAQVTNGGPDSASQLRALINLPASSDFEFATATGAGWSCSRSDVLVTCNHSGGGLLSGQQAAAITVAGRVVSNVSGTITFGSSVISTDSAVGDPNSGNNGPSQVIVMVNAGTDLAAKQTLLSTSTGQATLIVGEAVTLRLWAVNNGTQDATGVTLRTVIPAGFSIATPPAGCVLVLQEVTCTVGALAHGASSAIFSIGLSVLSGAVSGSNLVEVARLAPTLGVNLSDTAPFTIVAPFAHLTLSKTKSPVSVVAGELITSAIRVTNSPLSTSAASGTVTVIDMLQAEESYVSSSGAGWTCAAAGLRVTCTYTIAASLLRNTSLPDLLITTRAQVGYQGRLSNTACTGLSAGSAHQPPDNSSTGNCATAHVDAISTTVDLSITKQASVANLPATSNSFSYTLTISNAGPELARTVMVSDPLPHWYSGATTRTGGTATLVGAGAGERCVFGPTVNCTLLNLGGGEQRTITITLTRPMKSGLLLNTATVVAADARDSNPANNKATAPVDVEALTDISISAMAAAPDPVRVGETLVYTTSIRNNGPSTGDDVVLRQVIDPARMAFVSGSAGMAGSAANCVWVASFNGAPHAGESGVECSNFNLIDGELRQLIFKVIPVYPYPDALEAVYVSSAAINSATAEVNLANNLSSVPVRVVSKDLDLNIGITDTDYEQLPFGDALLYQLSVRNNGPSRATGAKLIVTPQPPAQQGAAAPYTMRWNAAASSLPPGVACSQPGGTDSAVICYFGATPADSVLGDGVQQVLGLKFDTGPVSNAPAGTLTYALNATIESLETGMAPFSGDRLPVNNSAQETTTMLGKTDLIMISKSVEPASPLSINQPFTYKLVVGNLGPNQAESVLVTDVLPAGLVLTGAPTVQLGAGAPLALSRCESSGSPVTVRCTVGALPVAANGADTDKLLTISLPVKAPYPAYDGPFERDLVNTASVAPSNGSSRDPNPANNTASVTVQIVKSSIAGSVYNDANRNDRLDAGEKITDATTFSLFGRDFWGNDIGTAAAPIQISSTAGDFLFDRLPRSDGAGYTIIETQPAGYLDRYEFAGSAGGVTAPALCDGVANCSDSAAHNSVRQIVLPAATAAIGYLFQEVAQASISGMVYVDANGNGRYDGSEAGIPGVVIRLSGQTSDGRDICVVLGASACTVLTGADGVYRFDGLPPSGAQGYTIMQVQPPGYADGQESLGTVTKGSAGTISGSAPQFDQFSGIVLAEGASATNYHFGERLASGQIGGVVYVDKNNDGIQNGDEAGIPGVTLTLSGTSSDGKAVTLTVVSGADGSYLFENVPASTPAGYTLSETQPATHQDGKTTVLPGSNGTAPAQKPVGSGNLDTISAIVVKPGDDLRGYLFGEVLIPQLKPPIINGYVWMDRSGSRVRPSDGSHLGVAGWTVELHQNGNFICRVTTNSAGFYQFDNLHCPGYESSGLPVGSGFDISFLKDGNRMPNVPVSTGAAGYVAPGSTRITNITLVDSAQIIEQNLPLDPAGVVYDAVTREPVAGAVVTLNGPAGFDSVLHLVGAAAAQTQTVGADGMYQFLLQNDFPSGVYTLSVAAPAGYLPMPSQMLLPCRGPLNVGRLPDPALIQASDTAPPLATPIETNPDSCTGLISGGARTTQYYLSFIITNSGSAPILNNHIPLDPVGSGSILVSKTTPLLNVARGDLVPYTITASNPGSAPLGPTQVHDLLPPGFRYRSGSATRNGVSVEPLIDGRSLRWQEDGFAPQEKKTYKLMLVVGSGVADGEYQNQAWAAQGSSRISNLAVATVRVVPDATFDCPDIIGTVFDDKNANGYQDADEAGLPGIRMATARGLLVTSDASGRFHVACPAIPNADRGSNFVMKLDERTLPSGYRVTTENPRDVRLTRGKVVKLNFGASVHRVVRLELTDAAFVGASLDLQPEWQGRIEQLIATLHAQPSILRIAYPAASDAALAAWRSDSIADAVRTRWRQLRDAYALVIEREVKK